MLFYIVDEACEKVRRKSQALYKVSITTLLYQVHHREATKLTFSITIHLAKQARNLKAGEKWFLHPRSVLLVVP